MHEISVCNTISADGQLYELMSWHDRFSVDLRPLVQTILTRRWQSPGICCQPYDIYKELIAREPGIIVMAVSGKCFDSTQHEAPSP